MKEKSTNHNRKITQKRTLGASDLEVSALGLGCMGLSYGPATAVSKIEVQGVRYLEHLQKLVGR